MCVCAARVGMAQHNNGDRDQYALIIQPTLCAFAKQVPEGQADVGRLLTRTLELAASLSPEHDGVRRLVQDLAGIDVDAALAADCAVSDKMLRKYDRAAVDYAWDCVIDALTQRVPAVNALRGADKRITYVQTTQTIQCVRKAHFASA